MNENLFDGDLVRLVAIDPQIFADKMNRWSRDSEYWRLLSSDAARMFSKKGTKEWIEKELDENASRNYLFMIQTLDDDRLIGEIGLDGVEWIHGDTFVGVSLGDRCDWDKGYGSDALRVVLRYAFTELNLWRVSLNVFEYNQRAIRSYEKVGFTYEGRSRETLERDGVRWGMVFMGISRIEWQALYEI